MNGTDILAAKQQDLLALIQPTTKLEKITPREYAGPCPKCGGKDRLHVHTDKGWFCRRCQGDEKWHDAIDFVMFSQGVGFTGAVVRLAGKSSITPEELQHIQAERERRQADEARNEQENYWRVIGELNASGIVDEYHGNPHTEAAWNERGLNASWQQYYRLGYCEGRTYKNGSQEYTAASLTIPYWSCFFMLDTTWFHDWNLVTLRHRLIGDAPGGKYRPHLSGLGNHMFFTDPQQKEPVWGDVLVVEGEIKAMLTWAALWDDYTPLAPGLHVIGLPGKSWKPEWITELNKADRVFICLDPDADREAKRLAEALPGKGKAFSLPGKIDDLLLAGAMDYSDLLRIMEF